VLLGNQPNPFNPETTISFTLGEYQDAISSCQIVIYNVRGQMVKNYDVNANSGSDILSVQWNGKDRNRRPVPSGIYLYQLVINGVPIDSRKMELMK
jgi:flagellar hook assembly protein FlgD